MLKRQSEVGDDNAKFKDFRAQALESQNMQVFVGMVKGDIEFKIFHSMIEYNDMFATNNLSGSVIGFWGDRPLAGSPWVFKITRDKPWAWPELEYVENAIELQGHFEQEVNKNTLWDTSGEPMKMRSKFPILVMVPYVMVDWLVKANWAPNKMILWIEKHEKDDTKFQKGSWELFNKFMMAAWKLYVPDKNSRILELDVDPLTATDEGL